jgi:hypothetical protein
MEIEDCDKVICAKKAPVPIEVEAGKTYYWCTCGRSKNQVRAHCCVSCMCMYIGICQVHTCARSAKSVQQSQHVSECVCVRDCSFVHVCMYIYMYVCMHACVCVLEAHHDTPRARFLLSEQPFCDGSHKGTEFAPMPWTAEEAGTKCASPHPIHTHIHTCICMYVCMYVCVCVCVYILQ